VLLFLTAGAIIHALIFFLIVVMAFDHMSALAHGNLLELVAIAAIMFASFFLAEFTAPFMVLLFLTAVSPLPCCSCDRPACRPRPRLKPQHATLDPGHSL
jgi:hypothetical protein